MDLNIKQKAKCYWHGLTLKPSRMQGLSSNTWVVASSHPCYSITWIWALYWTSPFRNNKFDYREPAKFNYKRLFKCGLRLETQNVMYYTEETE